jgi:hypothetical protein
VKAQAELNPSLDEARQKRIIETIEGQGLFVPSGILFGSQLMPYRPVSLPAGNRVFEVPVKPEFQDTQGRVVATCDLLAVVGPLYRVDYESVNASKVALEQSDDGATYRSIQEWTSSAPGGVRGPAIPGKPAPSRFLRLTAEASGGQAVLRELHVFALKGDAAATCPYAADSGPGAASNGAEPAWTAAPQATGFVLTGQPQFPEAPTEVRLCRTRTHLFIGITAKEPRMHAMVADLTERDGPLWKQECVDILLDTGAGLPYRFIVNPAGAQYDSQGGDVGWNGDWHLVAKKAEDGWAAVIAIPFKTLGAAPKRGDAWRVNFTRMRYNVTQETSAWAWDYARVPEPQFGVVRFE